MDDEILPAGEVLAGLEFRPLPKGWMPIDAAVLLSGRSPSGEKWWAWRRTDGLSNEELVGYLTVLLEFLGDDFVRHNRGEGSEDQEERKRRRQEVQPRPAGEVLAGLAFHALPDDEPIEEAFIIVKCLRADGQLEWGWRSTDGLPMFELVGGLYLHMHLRRDNVIDEMHAGEAEDD